MNDVVGKCAVCGGNLTANHTCPFPYGVRVKPVFSSIAEGCPWRSQLKCLVLHAAGRYGEDGCIESHCAFVYWARHDTINPSSF